MSNDTDMFFNACQSGLTNNAHNWLAGRSVQEKREGVLICYEYGHTETADALLSKLTFSQAAACLQDILTTPARFVRISADSLSHRIASNTASNRTLLVHSMAANNHATALKFLIEHKYIDIKSYKDSDQVLVAARCTSLEALDLLSPPSQRSEKDVVRIINSVLECSDTTTVMHICTHLPPATYNTASHNAIRNKNETLLGFLVQSIAHSQTDPSALLSSVCHECLRENWPDPVHEYARNNPLMLPGIFKRLQDLGPKASTLFVPFMSYYEKHLLTNSLAPHHDTASRPSARKM